MANLPVERSISLPKVQMNLKQKLTYGVGITAIGGLIVLPVVMMLLQLVVSLLALALVGCGLAGLFVALPFLNRWWRNCVLKLMKNEARRNPIETLENEYLIRQRAYEGAVAASTRVSAFLAGLTEKRDEMRTTHGRSDANIDRTIETLKRLVMRLRDKLAASGKALDEYKKFVAYQRDRWELSKQTGELAAMLKAAGGGDVMGEFLRDTAIESIRTSFHESFAELETILAGEEVAGLNLDIKLQPIAGLEFEPAVARR